MVNAASGECLGVYRAMYSYAAAGGEEVDMEEDHLVLLLERFDDGCAEFAFSFTPLLTRVSHNWRPWFMPNFFWFFLMSRWPTLAFNCILAHSGS
jgi:hypothetical protein